MLSITRPLSLDPEQQKQSALVSFVLVFKFELNFMCLGGNLVQYCLPPEVSAVMIHSLDLCLSSGLSADFLMRSARGTKAARMNCS